MTHQQVPVYPAIESERTRHHRARYEPSGAPIRCQLWDHRRLVAVVPVTLDDMGHPSDVVYKPSEAERVTRLCFVYGGKTFVYPIETVRVTPSRPLHLALGAMKLLDKFGTDALRAGR